MKLLDAVTHVIRAKTTNFVFQTCATRFLTNVLSSIPKIQLIVVKEQMQRLIAAPIAPTVLRTSNLPNQDTIIVSKMFATTFI